MENLMSAIPANLDHSPFLRRILYFDAATCVAMGLFLVLLAQPLAPLLGLPAVLLEIAGAALLPIAAFIAWAAFYRRGVGIVIAGNVAWVAASVLLVSAGWVSPTPLGYAFVLVQAAAVAVIAALEYTASK
jgi:hypothetical protein